jgi:hypothetical protein
LCKSHYKEWKKATKEERDNERARWAWPLLAMNLTNINSVFTQ